MCTAETPGKYAVTVASISAASSCSRVASAISAKTGSEEPQAAANSHHASPGKRSRLRALPNYHAVRDQLVEVAHFYADLQVLKHGPAGVRERACDAWYARNRERFPGLAWWEFAAACGSSLPVFALIALATREQLDAAEIDATVTAYFPGVSAVHILLDYFIDQAEDREHGELNFIACYSSSAEAVTQLRRLVTAALAVFG